MGRAKVMPLEIQIILTDLQNKIFKHKQLSFAPANFIILEESSSQAD
jgi:hypothetical protein